MRLSAKFTELDFACAHHRLEASGPPLCLHAQSYCRSDLGNADAHALCEPLRNPTLVSTARHPTRSDSDGFLFAWMAHTVNPKNCVAGKAATDTYFAFASPTERRSPAGIVPAQVFVRTPVAYLNVCEMRRYAESAKYFVNA